ncbi:MAG: outer membrane beta-barrel protein [Bacteroidales bacterium]|jgi:hypothetical protein|nr:outer membrane beta-barrel protein [Bacteroidales bacterium]
MKKEIMETEENEIVEIIKKTALEHEESYVEGAWENFVLKQRRRRRTLFLRISSGAAACLIFGLALLLINSEQSIVQNKSRSIIVENEKKLPVEPTIKQNFLIRNPAISEEAKKTDIFANGHNSIEVITIKHDTLNIIRDSLQSQSPKLITENKESTKEKEVASENASANKKERNDTEYVDKNILEQRSAQNQDIREKRKKVLIGLNLSPGINSTSTASSFNLSGGVNFEIKLLPKLSLTTGLQIEHQTIESNNSIEGGAIPANRLIAELTNLDIPVNITWRFLSKMSGENRESFYFSAGVSSLAYLGERYTHTMYKQELSESVTMIATGTQKTYKLNNVSTTSERKEEPFNAFDVAGRINLMFGFERPLSSHLYLQIEPYIKIPISGLASENLRYTTSGITCKISF